MRTRRDVAPAEEPVRTLVVWCPDWPVVAAGVDPHEPAAVVHANRVVACSAAARAEGVRSGLRRREAQSRCPPLAVLAADPDRDAREFEAVAAAVETLAPRIEVVRPGVLALATRGPSRYHGGDEALAARAADVAEAALAGRGAVRVGVADGLFAALLAARRRRVVEPGGSAAFLAPWPVAALERAPGAGEAFAAAELADLLRRLGLRTLGDVAALAPGDLLGRFGPDGARASRLARGFEGRPVLPRDAPPDLVVASELDPPADRVEGAAFVARSLAVELGERLAARGLACTRVAIEAETEHGETLSRLWRHEGALTPAGITERARWQLDGWLNGTTWAARPTAGVSLLRLVPDEVVADEGRQLGFWGGAAAADERAARGVARVQGLLGPEAIGVPERRGGRAPGEQVVLVPAHTVTLGRHAPVDVAEPWPGRLPAPSPALVHQRGVPAEVVDADGAAVGVSGRGLVGSEPERVSVGGARWASVVSWAGPWPVDERWWDPASRRRCARIQVVLDDGSAHLLALEDGRWSVEATYD